MKGLLCYSLLLKASLTFGAILASRQNTSVACNNSPALCSRPYSNITQLGAHDSPFLVNSSGSSNTISLSGAGNQNVDSPTQLSAGVRLLTAQVHNSNGEWHLCHTSCSLLDAGTLRSWLSSIKTWLDANPHDVVTILLVNSDNASPSELDAEFQAANIKSYAYTPSSTTTALETWPTLQDMIAKNTRLVTFVASLAPSSNTAAPYLLDEFTFVFENPYNVTEATGFSCDADRPPTLKGQTATAVSSGRLPLVNHFLDQQILGSIDTPNTSYIETTNGMSGVGNLQQAASNCAGAYGRAPAFLLVDFFDEGSAINVVNNINGIAASVTGQKKPSTTAALSSNSGVRTTGSKQGWIGAFAVTGLVYIVSGLVF
ncbi:hypothetical protein ACLMJK_004724 [Lecanora helva]